LNEKILLSKSNIKKNLQEDSQLLHKFKKILKMSHRIEISRIAQSLEIEEQILFEKLITWNESIPFKIDGSQLIVEDISAFKQL
jgi:hypothetical protein